MHIDTWSLALQTVNFLVLIWLLRRFLFRPVLNLVDQRRKALEATLADAASRQAEAAALGKTYADKLAGLSEERERLLGETRSAASQERAEVLSRAEGEARKIVESGKAEAAKELGTLSKQVAQRIGSLAVDLAERILSQTTGANVDDVLFHRLEKGLLDLTPDQRASLITEIDKDDGLVIVTARVLSQNARSQLTERLTKFAAPFAKAKFAVEPDLIAGAEIRYGRGVMSFTWRKTLEQSRQLLDAENVVTQ
ncbi:MAG: F0F1 ATP synthase subunit B [Rhizobiaceae bacterium]